MNNQNYLSIYAKSFSWAGFFLAKQTFENGSNLYDFCRTLDDIVDGHNELNIKKEIFLRFKKDFENKNHNNSSTKTMSPCLLTLVPRQTTKKWWIQWLFGC